MYTWEVLNRNDFEDLFNLAVKKVPPKYFSDHWLTGGEIWSLCGLDKYGKPAPSLMSAPFRQRVATTAGSINALLS